MLTLKNACELINKFESLDKFYLGMIKEFTKNAITQKTARKFLEHMMQISNITDDLNVPDNDKQMFKLRLTWGFTKYAESECRGNLLTTSLMRKKIYQQIIKEIKEAHQQERDEHNAALEKLKEPLKPEKVDFKSVTFFIKTIDKQLSNTEFMALSDSIDIEDKELDDKFQRAKVPKGFEKKRK